MIHPWFPDAKLGIFLHWGLYSVKGISESWSFFNGQISQEDYFAQADGFSAENYQPAEWAELFAQAGASYAVLTTKHHDGFSLWDTELSPLNAKESSAAGRDLIGPYCEALREQGLKVGLYFSHLDWSHPDYRAFPRPADSKPIPGDPYQYSEDGNPHPERWQRFLEFHRGQLEELSKRYHPDLLWFDGDWTPPESEWKFEELHALLHAWNPGVILNSRIGHHGDYATPEQAMPITPPEGPWEFCMTLNNSWGWRCDDEQFKSTEDLIEILVECISGGGNLLLAIGPKADGSIDPRHREPLLELGDWIRRHHAAVMESERGLPSGHVHAPSTLSKDGRVLYIFLAHPPRKALLLKGLYSTPTLQARVLGSQRPCSLRTVGGAAWLNVPGTTYIDVPTEACDPHMTVIEIRDQNPLEFYRGEGIAIHSN